MDCDVIQPYRVQPFDLPRADGGRPKRQLLGKLAQGLNPWLQLGCAPVVRGVLGKLVGGALVTEVVCVGANSVAALVRRRDDDG